MLRFIDLSVTLQPGPSEAVPVSIEYMDHRAGGMHLAELLGISAQALPGCMAWASERVSAITHSGTHVDAPFHYSPLCNGVKSRTIDEMPLDWFFGPAMVVDVEDKGTDEPVSVADLDGIHVEYFKMVLFRTGAQYGSGSYMQQGRGISAAVVEYLCDRKVRVIGTDAWSLDPPLEVMERRASEDGCDHVWEAHYTGRHREFCIVEKLQNLHLLPAQGFTMACFPVKVAAGSAGWTRAVAMIPEAP